MYYAVNDDTKILTGNGPVIIIGPNGVGKTRLGTHLAVKNGAERIAALRHIELGGVGITRFAHAQQQAQQHLDNVRATHWQMANELGALIQEVMAEDLEAGVKVRDLIIADRKAEILEDLLVTRRTRIAKIWNELFPGRTLSIDYNSTVTKAAPGGSQQYSPHTMSEGERTAAYLITRVLSCRTNLLFVDEPETYFHPLLARQLWDTLEAERRDIRFVYITHDLSFALSRRSSTFLVARSETLADVIDAARGIPEEIVAEVLGAASFSVSVTLPPTFIQFEPESGG
jgi:ABC-type glutathione transport system ATPase component